ncbi:MAG: hypothetical protein GXW93_21165 [Pseudomonas lactis]|nr:hypothetical protein [Pseudomonas lactis]
MSRFEQLRGWHTEQRKEVLGYWQSLQRSAEGFRQGYSKFLEAPEEGWRDSNGDERPYVTLASKINGEFKDVSFHDLHGADSWLDFYVGVTLDQSANQYPKKRIYTQVQMKKEDGGFRIKSDAPTFDFKVSSGPSGPEFDVVYDRLFEGVRENLSYRP